MTFSNFTDFLSNIEWLDAIIGAVVLMVLGWLWYGPLFGKKLGMDGEMGDPMTYGKGFVQFFLYGLGVVITFPAIHFVYQNAATFETLLVTAFVVSLFTAGMALISDWVWDNGGKFDEWLIHWGFWFVGAFAYGYVVLDLLV